MITALRTLAAGGFDALAQFTTPVADAIWEEAHRRPAAEVTLLDEIADHAAAIRHLLEDIRNLIASAAPSTPLLAAAAEGPASAPDSPAGAGHPHLATT
ncbi:hypothetical protein [Mycobacterium avium]|uniref:hypothetical protein n=1 Tax=Mycobacterium avium TaxID=1764 RepID=UPI000CE3F59B|nr:hypothetical protein [Mycobacterium avium]